MHVVSGGHIVFNNLVVDVGTPYLSRQVRDLGPPVPVFRHGAGKTGN